MLITIVKSIILFIVLVDYTRLRFYPVYTHIYIIPQAYTLFPSFVSYYTHNKS
ncbi:hypothetical protein BDF21DRAFT_372314, partial [Thamnidium elegans]